MKRKASLRFAVIAPGWISEMRALDRLCLLASLRVLSESSQGQTKQARDRYRAKGIIERQTEEHPANLIEATRE